MRGSSLLFFPLLFLLLALGCSSAAALKPPRLGLSRRVTQLKSFRAQPRHDSVSEGFQVRRYTQTLDHFNYRPDSYTTFQQRYVINFKYWGGANTSSPIFFFPGDEGPLDEWTYANSLVEKAARFNALLVYVEHRYYGESLPFGSREEALRNSSTLGYLSAAQALADYAELLVDLKKNLSAESCPVIASGCSYGGMLASWFRLKYPHIVIGALASSAPILYFDDITHQDGYDKVVTNDFKEVSESCYETIRRSWAEIDRIASQPNGLNELSQTFNTSSRLNDSQQLKDFLGTLYADSAQYGSPQEHPIKKLCDGIDGAPQGTGALGRISAGLKALGIEPSINVAPPPDNSSIPWGWQECTEIVSPLGTVNNDTMFQIYGLYDLNSFTKDCQDSYGATPRPRWITIEFGGHNIKQVLENFGSNIIFSNGLQDPYSRGGVLYNISDSIVALTTTHGSHCFDFLPSAPGDPHWLIAQRNAEIEIIEGWLAQYYAISKYNSGENAGKIRNGVGLLGPLILMGCVWALL